MVKFVVLLTVTLGAMFGLLAGSSSAFAHTHHVAGSALARAHDLHYAHIGMMGRHHHAQARLGRHRHLRFAHRGRHWRHFARHVHWRHFAQHRHWRHLARSRAPALVQPAMFEAGRPLELHPLLSVARQYLGHGRVSHARGPWCRDFVNTVARRAGYRLANTSRRAIDALSLGHRVSNPQPGDLVVMRHHVTIFAGYGGRGLIGLGGNQGRGGVTYSSFSRARVVGYVRL